MDIWSESHGRVGACFKLVQNYCVVFQMRNYHSNETELKSFFEWKNMCDIQYISRDFNEMLEKYSFEHHISICYLDTLTLYFLLFKMWMRQTQTDK